MVPFAVSLGNAGKHLINKGALSLKSLNWFLNVLTKHRVEKLLNIVLNKK